MTLRRMTHETTHRHNTSPVTRPRHCVHPAGAMAAAVVARNRPHPFECCRRRRCRRAPGGRVIVLQYRRLLRARVVTISVYCAAVVSCRVNCCRRPVSKKSGFNITINCRRLAAAADPATCESYFYNIDIGDLPMPMFQHSLGPSAPLSG